MARNWRFLNEAAVLKHSCTVFFSVAYLRMKKYTYQEAQLSPQNWTRKTVTVQLVCLRKLPRREGS